MNKLRSTEHERLTKLTLESNAAIKELKRKSDRVGNNKIGLQCKITSYLELIKWIWIISSK